MEILKQEALNFFDKVVLWFKGIILSGLNLPTLILLIILIIGIYLVFFRDARNQIGIILGTYLSQEEEEDRLFLKTGTKVKANQYRLALYVISLLVIFWAGLMGVRTGNIKASLTGILIAVILIGLFSPREKILGIKSPFTLVTDSIIKSRQKKLDIELYDSVITLKNLAIAEQEQPLAADLIFEKLMDNSKGLKPIYAEMIKKYRTGEMSEAFTYFSEAVGTKSATDFAMQLSKVDKMDAYELTNSVSALQEVMAEERYTRGLEEAERNGNIIYGFASAVCFICILNFAVVVVMMDAINMMNGIM